MNKGFVGLGRQASEAISSLTWGSPSVGAWKQACQDSLNQFRRRRELAIRPKRRADFLARLAIAILFTVGVYLAIGALFIVLDAFS